MCSELCAVFPSPRCCLQVFCYLWVAAAATRAKRQAGEWGTLSQWSTNRKLIKFIIDKFHVYCSERTLISLPNNERHRSYCTVVSGLQLHYTVLANTSSLTMFPISHPLLLIGISAISLIIDLQEIALKRTTQQKNLSLQPRNISG